MPGPAPAVAQAVELMRVWLDAERDYLQIPSLSASLVHDQTVEWNGAFGYADRERRVAATPATLYSICSVSKLFTSIAVMQLRDAGRVRLDDSVAQHLPWFAIRRSDSLGGALTVEGLLTHASGLPREADFAYWTGPDFKFPTREEMISHLARQETLYPAETYFQYSNLGLALAGEVVAAAAREPYDRYVRGHILEPLRLTSTTPEMPLDQRGKRLAIGYSALRRDGTRIAEPFFQARGLAPAAGYASSVEDLARFASWQFRDLQRQGGGEVLAPNTLREMQRVHWVDPDFKTTWGLGFAVWRHNDKTFVGHGGSCPGYRTALLLKPDQRIAVILMANAQGVEVDDLAQQAYDLVAPAIIAAAKDTARVRKQPDSTLALYAGSYESGFAGEVAVVPWGDDLALLGLPSLEPMKEIRRFKRVGLHTFRRVREDEALGEALQFSIGPDGRATQFVGSSNVYRRTR
jgi:CubicO group peptidase (beta-lactamase class C family)